jgi:tRNA threonylcarbamoyladenosine biosynthesis protein TsaE
MKEWLLKSPAETATFGAAVADAAGSARGCVVFLEGPLGAGKTTLARGLLRSLGVTGTIRSPTYTLLEPYALPGRTLIHLDLYRMATPREVQGLGLADYPPEQTWWLVEWPQNGGTLLPPPTLHLKLAHDGAARRVAALGRGPIADGIAAAYSARLTEIPQVTS